MSWQDIVGHDRQIERFRRSIQQQRLATTFLFVGPEGIGKRTFALKLAQAMLCSRVPEAKLEPCGVCPECTQVESNSHPDLQVVSKPADKAYIPVDTFIGDRDHRMRAGLCHFISLTPSGGKRRIAIVDDADWLNVEGANSLLKTLEEPSPGAVIILISTSLQRQLPTIRSRSQVIQFHPLADEQVADCLLRTGAAESTEQANEMASRAAGSISSAIAMSDPGIIEFRRALFAELAKPSISRHRLAKLVNEFADANGKEAAARRKQLRLAFDCAIVFYRGLLRACCESSETPDVELQQHISQLLEQTEPNLDLMIWQLDRCVESLQHVRSNANLGILVDAWVCDLATTNRRTFVVTT